MLLTAFGRSNDFDCRAFLILRDGTRREACCRGDGVCHSAGTSGRTLGFCLETSKRRLFVKGRRQTKRYGSWT